LYHVLGGALDPINGVGPNELRIAGLLRRVGEQNDGDAIAEISIATDPHTPREPPSTYLARPPRPLPDLVASRLPPGRPPGADLADSGEAETAPNAEPGRADAGPAAQSGQAAGSEAEESRGVSVPHRP